MKRKNIIAAIFCTFLLVPLLFSGGLQLFQLYLKQRVEERLNTETLVRISVAAGKVQWMEAGREIRVEGRMFDLKTYEEKNGIFTAVGVYDEEEDSVMEIFSGFNDTEQNRLLINLFVLIQIIAVCHAIVYIWLPGKMRVVHLSLFTSFYKSPYKSCFCPPPW